MMRTILTFIPALLFKAISSLRNLLFDRQVLSSQKFISPFILVIGNLSVGGTGKSPLVTYIVQHWPWKSEVGVLSRGYGRKTKGFQWVQLLSTAKQVGDEPLAYKKLFPHVPVAVCEKRPQGVQKMVDDFPEYHSTFDLIAGNADSNGVLYEVLEFAYRHLEVEAELRGGMDNLSVIDYSAAMDYAYEEWVN
jgi:tetraacyldisaccharide-1-P 4'-kinase